ncbi:MAG: cadherin repeat protein [Bacteroidota bacterium]|nr:cadherin repeat protein [Bacteroidota bacterium]
MKKVVFSSLLLCILIATSCKKSTTTTTPVETDKIKLKLSTSQAAYIAVGTGNWIEITAAEYNALATGLNNVTRAGVTEADYTNVAVSSTSSSGLYTIAQDDGATMPTGSYLFAFKISINSGTNSGAKVKVSSTSVTTGYSDLGSVLPTHSTGDHYFVLKGNTIATTATGYLAYTYAAAATINFKTIPGKGNYSYGTGDVNVLPSSTTNDVVFLAQGLSTTVKQW